MYRKIVLTWLLMMVCSISFVSSAFAFSVDSENDPQNIIHYIYNSSNDQMVWKIEGTDIVELRKITYTDSAYTNVYADVTTNASPNYYSGVGVSCPGVYQIIFKDDSGSSVASVKFTAHSSDFADTSGCGSMPTEQEPQEPQEPEPQQPEEPQEPEPQPQPQDADGDGIPDTSDEYPNDPDNDPCNNEGMNEDTCIPEDEMDEWQTDENQTEYEACQEQAQTTGIDWRYMQNPETGEYDCVTYSDCMYDDSLWYCSAQEYDPNSSSGESGGGETVEDGTTCEVCAVFECPAWDQYMGYLGELANNIVGDITIPEIPEPDRPSPPNIFDILNGVDERNDVQKPTGQEDSQLNDATFNANDIKNDAQEIPFRDDPTGGFNIVNPLENLPSDGSTAPLPQETETTIPEESGEQGSAPIPSEPEGEAIPPTYSGETITPPTNYGGE